MTAEPSVNPNPSPLADSAAAPVQDLPRGSGAGEGFFHADGDDLIPTELADSPWGAVLHGRLIGGLTARAAERARAQDPNLICARLTIDMFRSAPLAPMRASVRPIRAGRRIAVLEVTVEQDKGPIGQGKVVLLRRSEQPWGTFRPAPDWAAPAPDQLGPPPSLANGRGLGRAEGHRWNPPWQAWPVRGPSSPLSDGVWIRDVYPLIAGEELTPLVRLAMAADLASPHTNSSDRGLHFINADYTVYLGRVPQGEYVGIQPHGHISDRGVGVGQAVAHDVAGPVGFIATAAVANS
jgi:Thioesterase-like superfamily